MSGIRAQTGIRRNTGPTPDLQQTLCPVSGLRQRLGKRQGSRTQGILYFSSLLLLHLFLLSLLFSLILFLHPFFAYFFFFIFSFSFSSPGSSFSSFPTSSFSYSSPSLFLFSSFVIVVGLSYVWVGEVTECITCN